MRTETFQQGNSYEHSKGLFVQYLWGKSKSEILRRFCYRDFRYMRHKWLEANKRNKKIWSQIADQQADSEWE